ncbi:DUF6541 family protein [Saccharothrix sp. NPDC042600]|uniref:DUF6541 family protein n=1 Tax=Saccharothrix TaxID=2071 RepID=UPI0033F21F51|nr:hypothetical protein GCM10017745_05010 [Saccharothrix mutabilis subsp. capreolus]
MTARDVGAVLVALLVVGLPGTGLLSAAGVRRPLWFAALAVPGSAAVATVVAIGSALTGLPHGPLPLAVVTALLLAVGAVRLRAAAVARRRQPGAVRLRRFGVGWRRGPGGGRLGLARAAGPLLALVAVGVSGITWLFGLRRLSTVNQEHDMVVHHVLTAYIERTGRGAPWQVLPADVLTGADVTFYPAGLHLLMAPVATLVGDTVVGVNAVTVVVLGFAWAVSVAALGYVAGRRARLGRVPAGLAAGFAALVAVGLYRPVFSLVHEGGILPNAAALVLTPGVLAALLSVPRRGWGPVVALGVACAGLVAIHPSAVATVGVSLVAWLAGEALTGRRVVRELPRLPVVGVVALVVAAPVLARALGVADGPTNFRPDTPALPFATAVENALLLPYGGFVPHLFGEPQLAAALVTLLGAVAVVVFRRGFGVLAAWLAWVVVEVLFATSPATGPDALVTGFFYHAHLRVWSHISLFAPVLAGLGTALVASALALRLARRPAAAGSAASEAVVGSAAGGSVGRRWAVRWAVVVLMGVAAAAYLVWPAAGYARVDANYLAGRFARPDFVRVGPDDRAAGEWLAARVRPGERILNSANDGSTFLYVEHGLPVVNVSTLGAPRTPYTYGLLRSFNTYPTDPGVRRELRDLNVRWVYVDSAAPRIGASGAPEGWVGGPLFSTAPGLERLAGLPGLTPVFRSGTVSVYEVDPATP